jgi:hypothetical protein
VPSGASQLPVVDVGDRTTWPADVIEWVAEMAEPLRDTTEYISDLQIYGDEQDQLLALLGGTQLRAYHCTRLLQHEVDRIRTEGLRALDNELVTTRIDDALASGHLSVEQAKMLHANTVFARREHRYRQGAICAVLCRADLDHGAWGLWRLLGTWGGEGIYAELGEGEARESLTTIGTPMIVVFRFTPRTRAQARDLYAPDLAKLFVGVHLELPEPGGEVHFRSSVPAGDIEALWQPGDADYDRHRDLVTD